MGASLKALTSLTLLDVSNNRLTKVSVRLCAKVSLNACKKSFHITFTTAPRSRRLSLNICTSSTWSPTPLTRCQRASWAASLSCSMWGWRATSWPTRASLPTPSTWRGWWSWTWASTGWRGSPRWAARCSTSTCRPTRSKVPSPPQTSVYRRCFCARISMHLHELLGLLCAVDKWI